MQLTKPIRIIDVSKKLNLSTSTIIIFLKQNCYPVERSHHTPLLPEMLDEIGSREYLRRYYGLDAASIAANARQLSAGKPL